MSEVSKLTRYILGAIFVLISAGCSASANHEVRTDGAVVVSATKPPTYGLWCGAASGRTFEEYLWDDIHRPSGALAEATTKSEHSMSRHKAVGPLTLYVNETNSMAVGERITAAGIDTVTLLVPDGSKWRALWTRGCVGTS